MYAKQEMKTGIYGKLPAHGDFVHRHLPTDFITTWDEWLQNYIAGSQEQIGEHWLNIYLTSPIWRFAVSKGAIDNRQWAGVMMPSVDRVGRYFPFSVVTCLPDHVSVLDFISNQSVWFKQVEGIALQALHGELNADDAIQAINEVPLSIEQAYQKRLVNHSLNMVVAVRDEQSNHMSVMPQLFESCLNSMMTSFSVWSTEGSEYVAPCVLSTQNLPVISGIAAMLDGQWQQWQWQEPFYIENYECN